MRRSSFSGSGTPASPVAGLQYLDTGSKALKVYNSDGDAWLAQLIGDASFKIPVYRNDTCDGWLIDATVTDRVIALKGGAQAYNANGGTNAGSFTYTGFTMVHTHPVSRDGWGETSTAVVGRISVYKANLQAANSITSGAASTSAVTGDGTDRPAAALCTLQYPDLT